MRKLFFSSLAIGAFFLVSSTATAQERRQPHTGSQAVGFEVGAWMPNDDQFENDLLLNGLYEYYVHPRVGLRTEFGWTDPGLEREPSDSLRQMPLRLDINYNWEGGSWHPFVGAGAGVYFLRGKDNNRPIGETEKEPGINFQGGLEYFFTESVTMQGEARYHRIDTPTGGTDPSGWAVTLGMKLYYD